MGGDEEEIRKAIALLEKYNIKVIASTLRNLNFGDAFYWLTPRDCGKVRCRKVHVMGGKNEYYWVEADKPKTVCSDDGRAIVIPAHD